MKRIIGLTCFAIITAIQFCPAQQGATPQRTKFSAKEVKNDLAYLYETLEQTHYDLYVNTPKAAFEKRYREISSSVKDSLSLLQATRLFQSFAALSGLAHCSVKLPWQLYGDSLVQNEQHLFPLDLTVRNKRAFVTANYSGNAAVLIGDEIISIDGTLMKDRLSAVYGFLSGESEEVKNTLIDLYAFPRLHWWIYGDGDRYALRVKHKNGNLETLTVRGIQTAAFEEQASKKADLFNTGRWFNMIGGIAYLHPGVFMNQSGSNTSDHQTFEKSEFISFIDSSFREVRRAGAKDLIIDLRGNPGGDNSFSDPMIAYFATKPFWFCSAFNVRTSAITKEFWKDVTDSSLRDLKAKILAGKDGERFSASFKNYLPRTDSLRFKGKVYVLIDRYSYSNTVSVAAIIQDYQFGTLIGEPTADVASSYGAIHEFGLPVSQLRVSYPKAFMVRPNGNKALKGVVPDIRVMGDALTDKDEILDFTIEHIRKK